MSVFYQVESINGKTLSFEKIGIIYNTQHDGSVSVVNNLESIFEKYGFSSVRIKISPEKGKLIGELNKDISFAIVIGGDGTFLRVSRSYSKYNIPIFGVNVGRLGFLSQFSPRNIEEGLKKLAAGKFTIQERLMLKAFDKLDNPKFHYVALNDIVIRNAVISRTSQLFLYINNKHVCDYIADGLIISTPTGSTAYTLSAGGPVVVPGLESIVIVPICPHSLTTRPIVIPSNEEIIVRVDTDSDEVFVTADGQENVKISTNCDIHVRKNDDKAKLILLENENNGFYSILREKLHWGVAPVSKK